MDNPSNCRLGGHGRSMIALDVHLQIVVIVAFARTDVTGILIVAAVRRVEILVAVRSLLVAVIDLIAAIAFVLLRLRDDDPAGSTPVRLRGEHCWHEHGRRRACDDRDAPCAPQHGHDCCY